ncbi:MAG: transporter [Hydrogenophilales bacterium 12-61-10]|nr:MAG: transporter [Hydrogenophilales bacterium 12-61-10]OYX28517.1 MAG: transporter [Hydrogenophilales bacterium 32-62-9]
MRFIVAAFALLLSLFSATSHAWWNDDWAGRKQVTLTNPAGEVADAPVLIRLHTGNFDFLSANENGSDLRVVAGDDTTELKFHIEKWDGINQLALVWVKLPKLGATTSAWLYFGNETAAPASDAKGTYDASSADYHFAEAAGNPADSGPNGLNATAFTGERVAASFANGGVKFNGTQSLALPAINAAGGMSVAMWVKPAALDGTLVQAGGLNAALVAGALNVQAGAASVAASAPLTAGAWHYVAITVSDSLKVYVDGKLAGEAPGASLPSGGLTLGASYSGEMDEVQLAGTARDTAWFAVQAAQGPAGTLVALGADELAEGGEEGGIWGTLFAALTLDGWIAIGILAVMLVIAIWIMIVKAIYVNRVDQANRQFMHKFRELSDDLGAIDRVKGPANEFKHSSLYHLYHVATVELSHRFKDHDAVKKAEKNLSPQSLEAIRASLDTGLVKETTRMNKLMVLLTIAISGGPFIGLLGTVLGVMITFAVIAATGDVNVAAIAPGIAAALMATAAGMAVAIPALFGYNYLNSRIKAITSDMRVFNDELITKLAENYSR